MLKQCRLCNARCCRYFCFQIDNPCTYEEFEQVRWYLTHQNISVHVDGQDAWWIFIENRCRWLEETPAGPRCADYANRPIICRQFSPKSCEFARGPFQPAMLFDTADELEAYARQVLGAKEFDAERARIRGRRRRVAGKTKRG